jgi:hypothetical protein
VHGSIKVNWIHPLPILIRLSACEHEITLESLGSAPQRPLQSDTSGDKQ